MWRHDDPRWFAVGFILTGAAVLLVIGAWGVEQRQQRQTHIDATWNQFINDVLGGSASDLSRFRDENLGCDWMRAALADRTPLVQLAGYETPIPLSNWEPPSHDVARRYLDKLCS